MRKQLVQRFYYSQLSLPRRRLRGDDVMDFVHMWIPGQARDDNFKCCIFYDKQQVKLEMLVVIENSPQLSAVIPGLTRDPYMGVAHTIKWTKSIQDTRGEASISLILDGFTVTG